MARHAAKQPSLVRLRIGYYSNDTLRLSMETIRIVTEVSKHVGCGGVMAMSQDAPQYILEHEGLETTVPGSEMVCLRCGERIRSQDQVETPGE
jgi:hypothetical protein